MSFLGGSEQDEVRHESYKNDSYILKYLALPFVLAAAPFKAAYDAAQGEPEAGPEVPRTTQQKSRLPAPTTPHSSMPGACPTGRLRTRARRSSAWPRGALIGTTCRIFGHSTRSTLTRLTPSSQPSEPDQTGHIDVWEALTSWPCCKPL